MVFSCVRTVWGETDTCAAISATLSPNARREATRASAGVMFSIAPMNIGSTGPLRRVSATLRRTLRSSPNAPIVEAGLRFHRMHRVGCVRSPGKQNAPRLASSDEFQICSNCDESSREPASVVAARMPFRSTRAFPCSMQELPAALAESSCRREPRRNIGRADVRINLVPAFATTCSLRFLIEMLAATVR